MNEQERGMIDGLFDRLQQAELKAGPKDTEADALIRERMANQPGAGYLMAQVVLVQEQGLNNLQGRVEELERQLAERPQGGTGFLGGLFGTGQEQPAARPTAPAKATAGGGWSNSTRAAGGRGAASMAPQAQGGGFMAGAMQTAVGVAGGMLLANAVAGMFAGDAEASETPTTEVPPAPEPTAAEEEIPEEDIGGEDGGGLFGGDLFGGDLFGGDDEEGMF